MPESHGLVSKDPMNVQNGGTNHNSSSFSPSYRLYNTHRFGEYNVPFVMEGVPSDITSLQAIDTIRSFSLKSPLLSGLRKKKMLFMVPNMAMLPLNWSLIYANPTAGDDVPFDANTVITEFPSLLSSYISNAFGYLISTGNQPTSSNYLGFITASIRTMIILEYFLSHGSLLNTLGYKCSSWFKWTSFVNSNNPRRVLTDFDGLFDTFITQFFSDIDNFTVTWNISPTTTKSRTFTGLGTPVSSNPDYKNTPFYGSLRSFLQLARENPAFVVTSVVFGNQPGTETAATASSYSARIASLSNALFGADNYTFSTPVLSGSSNTGSDVTDMSQGNFNFSRLLAYQLSVAHFESNDKIDNIYSADLYRSYISALENAITFTNFTNTSKTFVRNGFSLPYDYLSGHFIRAALFDVLPTSSSANSPSYSNISASNASTNARLMLFASIFGWRRSLRYVDYFTGSRLTPLAVGNTDVEVSGNNVSIIDVTRNIQKQRFLNAVNRVGSRIENYTKELFGREPNPDYHNPFYIVGTDENVFPDETQNTGAAQVEDANSITSNFRSPSGKYYFEFDVKDEYPCVFIQLVSYDIRRAYTRTVERHFLHGDRFDMFNPYFQFIGDQKVYGIELGALDSFTSNSITPTFGYQGRYMEYKQRFDQASGGFVKNLPGWAFLAESPSRAYDNVLSSDFIRSLSTEMDDYYLSLTGYSLGNYFHFIVETDNIVNANRPMVYQPNIL